MRLFAGIAFDDETRAAFARALDSVRALADAKWTRADKAHLTLVFLGDADVRVCVARLQAVAARHGALSLQLRGAGAFSRRVLWLGVGGDLAPLRELQADLERTLEKPGEHAAYTPHVTLARARRPRGDRALEQAAAALASFESAPFPVRALTLFDSRGGGYQVIAQAQLK
jgi:RNA 2',3'-cyclic 3'-phosphodiesterase